MEEDDERVSLDLDRLLLWSEDDRISLDLEEERVRLELLDLEALALKSLLLPRLELRWRSMVVK